MNELRASVTERINDETFRKLLAVRVGLVRRLKGAERKREELEAAWRDHAREDAE